MAVCILVILKLSLSILKLDIPTKTQKITLGTLHRLFSVFNFNSNIKRRGNKMHNPSKNRRFYFLVKNYHTFCFIIEEIQERRCLVTGDTGHSIYFSIDCYMNFLPGFRCLLKNDSSRVLRISRFSDHTGWDNVGDNTSVIRQKGEYQNGCFNISYILIGTRTCAYHGVRNVHFSENLACFVFLNHPF